MEFAQSETRTNLMRSFAGESQARERYTVYAGEARSEGWEQIARVFEEIADNEAVHAELFLRMLKTLGGETENGQITAGYPYQLGVTCENLGFSADGEKAEFQDIYPAFAEIARREGFKDAARLWMQIARIEENHHAAFRSLEESLLREDLTEKEERASWKCIHCGYVYEGIRACDPCPVCGKSAGWQKEIKEKNG